MEAEAEAAAAMAAQAVAEANATAATAAQAVAEAAAMTAQADLTEAKEDLDAAEMAAMTANAAKTAAETALAVAESEARAAKEARMMADEAKMMAETARDAAVAAQTEAVAAQRMAEAALATANARVTELEAELAAGPDTAGTTEGGEGRAAAARIVHAATPAVPDIVSTLATNESRPAMIRGGVIIKALEQERLGRDPKLTIELADGAVLDSSTDKAEMDAPDVGADWMGVALEKTGAGGITQKARVYSDAERSVRAFGDAYPYNRALSSTNIVTAGVGDVPTHRLILNVRRESDATNVPGPNYGNDPATIPNETYVSVQDDKIELTHGLSVVTGDTSEDFVIGNTLRGKYDGVPGQYTFAEVGDTSATPPTWLRGPHLQAGLDNHRSRRWRSDIGSKC